MHGHEADGSAQGRLVLALSITFAALVVEIWGAMWTGSLALLADAGHMLSDVAALSIALAAAWFAGRPHTWSSTFGLHRTEVLAATGNAVGVLPKLDEFRVEAELTRAACQYSGKQGFDEILGRRGARARAETHHRRYLLRV